jgi:peroxiredoxin
MKAKQTKQSPAVRKVLIYTTIGIVLVALFVGVGLASRRDVVPDNVTTAVGESKLKVGDTAPDFSIATNAGNFHLADVSTPILVEVFAPWCPHCQRETTALNDLAAKYAGKIAIVSVSGDPQDYEHNQPESQQNVTQFAAQYHLQYPVAFDSQLKVAALYLRVGFPSIYVIDKHKKIVYENEGETPESDIKKAILATL